MTTTKRKRRCTSQKEKDLKFDNKLIKHNLVEFTRVSDYKGDKDDIVLYHKKCQNEFLTKPLNFFRRKGKCPFCDCKKNNYIPKRPPMNKSYQKKLDELTNGEFLLLSDYHNLTSYIKLRHLKCGHEFEIRADNFESRANKCPNCSDILLSRNSDMSLKIKKLESLLNNEFKILTKFFYWNDTITIMHKKCEHIFDCNVTSFKYLKDREDVFVKCPKCALENRREDFLDKLDRLQNGEFRLISKYNGSDKVAKFRHTKCKKTFYATPSFMTKRKYNVCPECKSDEKYKKFAKKLSDFYNDEYEITKPPKVYYNEKIELLHKKCNKTTSIFINHLFKTECPCSECRKKDSWAKKIEEFKIKLKNKYNNKFELIGDYYGSKKTSKFICNDCKAEFTAKVDTMLHKNKKCRQCDKNTKK